MQAHRTIPESDSARMNAQALSQSQNYYEQSAFWLCTYVGTYSNPKLSNKKGTYEMIMKDYFFFF